MPCLQSEKPKDLATYSQRVQAALCKMTNYAMRFHLWIDQLFKSHLLMCVPNNHSPQQENSSRFSPGQQI